VEITELVEVISLKALPDIILFPNSYINLLSFIS